MKTATAPVRHAVAGFTLPELMTTLVLVTVVLSVAVPRMTGYVDMLRTRRALDQVAADIAYARLIAIQQGRQTAVRFGSDGQYTVDTLSSGGSWGALRRVQLQEEYRGVTFEASAPVLEFSSRGLIRNVADGVVRMHHRTARDSLFVSQSGRVYRAY